FFFFKQKTAYEITRRDWSSDVCSSDLVALSAKPKFGFEGWRRMGYAHFAGSDSGNVGFLKRRTGDPMLTVTQVTVSGDSVLLTQDARVMMRAAWHGDTLTGVQWNGDRLLDRR